MVFDNGETHNYNEQSVCKLQLAPSSPFNESFLSLALAPTRLVERPGCHWPVASGLWPMAYSPCAQGGKMCMFEARLMWGCSY